MASRKVVRTPRLMAMHKLEINCITDIFGTVIHGCQSRYEWREIKDIDESTLYISPPSKYNKASGNYVPVKF